MGFRFRQFRVYKEIRIFIKEIYILSAKFPKEEKYCLIDQIRRAAVSIILNLAEGAGKASDIEFNRFVKISIGSINEVVAVLDVCLDLGYISNKKHQDYLNKSEAIIKQLYGLSRTLKSSKL